MTTKQSQSVGKRGSRKIGNQKARCERYRQSGILLRHKLKRILRSNGTRAATSYRQDPTRPFPKEKQA